MSLSKSDNLEHLQISGEAIQNVGSIFNEDKMQIKDLIVTNSFNLIPRGTIVVWKGNEKDCPNGWAICDGTNDTPDMRGRAVICSGQGKGLTNRITGELGGEEKHTLTINELPKHSHRIPGLVPDPGFTNGPWSSFRNVGKGIDTDGAGNDEAHNTMPPYISLYYIMKL